MTGPVTSYARLTAGGTISGSQTWSTGISLTVGGGAVTQSSLDAALTAFRTAFTTFWGATGTGTLGGGNTPDVALSRFRGYVYAFPGQPASLQSAQDISPIAAAGAQAPLPTQCCAVATLLTGLPGRSFRGRMYLPITAKSLGSNHQLTLGSAQALADGVKAVIDAVNAQTTSTGLGDVVVAGRQGNALVRSVRVDTEIDIQRRRADKILAAAAATATIA